ncbi:hypothetical protein D7V94_13550 [Parablautia intestinalis]|uniref:Uncharacterized protein n=1 Tax=Parablautia intestinalis TaxID=2320100 RepID=A0A3A9AS91_9FIRM|nr:hypothetical protein D7V94_13550 [Parablautia intestinalis]
MRCYICGRTLKSRKSKELGYGPVCYKRMFGANLQSNKKSNYSHALDVQHYDIPGQMTLDEYLQSQN